MRIIPSLVGISFLCMLVGCVTTDPSGGTHAPEPSRTEIYTNAPSQFCFPPRVGGFEREKVTQYDRQGADIGIGYNDSLHGIAITVFVYPIAPQPPNNTLMGHFATCKAEVFGHHSGAQLVSEDAIQISPGGDLHSGQHASFTYTDVFAGQRQPVGSELFVFTHGQFFIMYRATYPVGLQSASTLAIRTFIDALPWPK